MRLPKQGLSMCNHSISGHSPPWFTNFFEDDSPFKFQTLMNHTKSLGYYQWNKSIWYEDDFAGFSLVVRSRQLTRKKNMISVHHHSHVPKDMVIIATWSFSWPKTKTSLFSCIYIHIHIIYIYIYIIYIYTYLYIHIYISIYIHIYISIYIYMFPFLG